MKRNKHKIAMIVAIIAWTVFVAVLLAYTAINSVAVCDDIPATENAPETILTAIPDVYEENENDMIEAALLERATKIENCKVTFYDCCYECCGKEPSHPAYGITASGLKATPGVTVAVDKSIIPLGSDVLVDFGDGEIHYMRADDTGSVVKGNHIDICVSSHDEALEYGVKTATVWFVKE